MELPRHHELDAVVEALRSGKADDVDDRDLDRLFPKDVRGLARLHWTPVAVALAAARFLAEAPGTRVLDVGAGAGKFAVVAALATKGDVTGVESDGELAEVARGLVKAYRVPRLRVVEGDVFGQDWGRYGGLYFYNPFTGGDEPAFVAAVAEAGKRLSALAVGTRLALHHGYGGAVPSGYRRVDTGETAHLTLWMKEA